MKRKGYLWEQFISKENIASAFYASIKGKTHRKDVKRILESPDIHLQQILTTFEEGSWIPSPYTTKLIHDKNKIRELSIPPFYPDRIIHHMINQILEPLFVPSFIKDTYQCIKGRGVHKAIKKAESNMQSGNWGYVLKVDIRKFYPNIDNTILKQKIARKIKDTRFLNVVNALIDSSKGVPIGNHTSQLLANIYLHDLDHLMKSISKSYIRYADDFIMMFKTKEEAKKAFSVFKEYSELNNLKVNPSSQYFDINARTLVFLGFRMYETHTRPNKRILQVDTTKNKHFESKASIFGWIKESKSTIFLVKVFLVEINSKRKHFIKYHIRKRIDEVNKIRSKGHYNENNRSGICY